MLVLNVLSTASMRNTAASVSLPGKLLCKFIIRNIPSALILIILLRYQVMIMNTYPESSNRPNVIREKGPTKRRNPLIASFYNNNNNYYYYYGHGTINLKILMTVRLYNVCTKNSYITSISPLHKIREMCGWF